MEVTELLLLLLLMLLSRGVRSTLVLAVSLAAARSTPFEYKDVYVVVETTDESDEGHPEVKVGPETIGPTDADDDEEEEGLLLRDDSEATEELDETYAGGGP